jgi:hypothetical protein
MAASAIGASTTALLNARRARRLSSAAGYVEYRSGCVGCGVAE